MSRVVFALAVLVASAALRVTGVLETLGASELFAAHVGMGLAFLAAVVVLVPVVAGGES